MIIYYTDKFEGGREESRRLLEKVISVHTGDENRAKTLIGALKKEEHGKPYIEGFSCFSISHTGSIWAVLVADCECGLDIQIGRNCDFNSIAKRWFDPEDDAMVADHDGFFRIWTRREALVKALGGTVYDAGLPAVSCDSLTVGGRQYNIRDIVIPEMADLYAAVCTCFRGSTAELRFIRL